MLVLWFALVGAVDPALNMKERLTAASQKLGNVAEGLLSVQSDVNRVERESLGKVFDLQTLRTFFAAHQRLEAENDALKASAKEFEQRIKDLTAAKSLVETKAVQDAAAASTALETAQEASHSLQLDKIALNAKVAEGEASIGSCNANLTKELASTGALKSTIASGAKQIGDLDVQVKAMQKKAIEVDKVHLAKFAALGAGTKSLEDQLQLQHNYGMECHSKLMQAQEKLGAAAVDTSGLNALQQALEAQKSMTADLQSRTQELMQEMTQKDLELSQVKYQSGKEVLKLKSTVGNLETSNTAIGDALKKSNTAVFKAEGEVQELKRALLATSTKELEHKVTVLQSEVEHTSDALKHSQLEEAKAKSGMQQAIAYQHAAEETARLNAEAAKNAAALAESEVSKAAQRSLAAQTTANVATAKAEASMSEQCAVTWNEMNTGFATLKDEHAQTVAELKVNKAQVKLLAESCQKP
jgi:chromosome segregation ATPase